MVTAFLTKIGKKGGYARAKSMPEAERKAASARGGASRWAGLSAEERDTIMAKVRATRWRRKRRPRTK